jgi:6-phosphogluconolactonase (cycloisomerase 2 family)
VNTEYSAEVVMLTERSAEAAGPWLELRGSYPLSAKGARPGDAAAEICLDGGERHLYVGVRGSDVIARLVLDADGAPSPLDEIPCGGAWPRHHCIDGDRLVVALERSHALATFGLGPAGDPGQPPQLISSGSPTCVLPNTSVQ